jgi:eukaryotic-like serine/threonine-protein kinase
VDATNLFEIVLQCQQRRHGQIHPDVASALHNVGIAHLRSQKHPEALTAFEEATRVRKSVLGKDHPLVAVRSPDVDESISSFNYLTLHSLSRYRW